ncbi:hypothetical protein MTO96_022963 [Rhipicephalus appendiculatus]
MSSSVCSDWCEVYLCGTPLREGTFINGAVSAITLSTSSSHSAAGNSWVMHWLLMFDYGGDEVLICDANSYAG